MYFHRTILTHSKIRNRHFKEAKQHTSSIMPSDPCLSPFRPAMPSPMQKTTTENLPPLRRTVSSDTVAVDTEGQREHRLMMIGSCLPLGKPLRCAPRLPTKVMLSSSSIGTAEPATKKHKRNSDVDVRRQLSQQTRHTQREFVQKARQERASPLPPPPKHHKVQQ